MTYTASATSFLLAAMIVAATWMSTLSTPANATAAPATAASHIILA